MKYYKNEQWNDLKVKVSDTLPKGTEVDYNGTTVPDGWEQIEDVVTGDSLPYGSIVEYDGDAVPDGYEEVPYGIVKARSTSNVSASSAGFYNVPMNIIDYNVGNMFELSNNKLKYKGTEKVLVKVSCQLWVERDGNSYAWCRLYTDNSSSSNQQMQSSYLIGQKPSNAEVFQCATLVALCELTPENPYIYPTVYYSYANSNNKICGGSYGNSTFMIVEIIN